MIGVLISRWVMLARNGAALLAPFGANRAHPIASYLKVTLLRCKNVSVYGTVTTGVHIGAK